MSYILDALKKADRERNLAKVPTLTTVHIPVFITRQRVTLWTLTGILLMGSLLFWFLRPSPTGVPVAGVDPRKAVGTIPPVNMGDPARMPIANQPVKAPPTAVETPGLSAPSVGIRQEAHRETEREPAVILRPGRPFPGPSSKSVPQPIDVERVQPRSTDAGRASTSPPPESQSSREANQVRMDPIVSPSVSSPPIQPALPDAMAKMTLDVFVYADSEADRMVTINGRRYMKGQLVDGRYLVEDITPEGVLLSFQGERALLRP